MLREDCLIQFTNASSRIYNEESVITTNYSTRICFLTESLNISFDKNALQAASSSDSPKEFIVRCLLPENRKYQSGYELHV